MREFLEVLGAALGAGFHAAVVFGGWLLRAALVFCGLAFAYIATGLVWVLVKDVLRDAHAQWRAWRDERAAFKRLDAQRAMRAQFGRVERAGRR